MVTPRLAKLKTLTFSGEVKRCSILSDISLRFVDFSHVFHESISTQVLITNQNEGSSMECKVSPDTYPGCCVACVLSPISNCSISAHLSGEQCLSMMTLIILSTSSLLHRTLIHVPVIRALQSSIRLPQQLATLQRPTAVPRNLSWLRYKVWHSLKQWHQGLPPPPRNRCRSQ